MLPCACTMHTDRCMAKKKKSKFKMPERVIGELIDSYVEQEGVVVAVLEPREWYDHAMVDIVQDPSNWTHHVVYDRGNLVYWHTLMCLYQKNKYSTFKSLESAYVNADEDFHDMCTEHVEYNTIRSMPYMGPNRPQIRVNLAII